MAALTEYEAYSLDVSGYIVLPAVLSAAELHALRNDVDGATLGALGPSCHLRSTSSLHCNYCSSTRFADLI